MFLNGDPNKLQNGYKVKTIFNKFDIDYIINKLVLSDRGKVFALNVPVELNIQLLKSSVCRMNLDTLCFFY